MGQMAGVQMAGGGDVVVVVNTERCKGRLPFFLVGVMTAGPSGFLLSCFLLFVREGAEAEGDGMPAAVDGDGGTIWMSLMRMRRGAA